MLSLLKHISQPLIHHHPPYQLQDVYLLHFQTTLKSLLPPRRQHSNGLHPTQPNGADTPSSNALSLNTTTPTTKTVTDPQLLTVPPGILHRQAEAPTANSAITPTAVH